MLNLNDLVSAAHKIAVEKGWYEGGPPNIPEKLALIHSEVSEALEEYRSGYSVDLTFVVDGKPTGFPTELADIVIRVASLCGYLGIDLGAAIRAKMDFNATRPHRHGGKVC